MLYAVDYTFWSLGDCVLLALRREGYEYMIWKPPLAFKAIGTEVWKLRDLGVPLQLNATMNLPFLGDWRVVLFEGTPNQEPCLFRWLRATAPTMNSAMKDWRSKCIEKLRSRGSLRGRSGRCLFEFGLSWLMLELCCDIFGGKMATKSPKTSQDGAQEPQDEPRWRPRAPRWRPRGRQMQPRWRSWLDFGTLLDQFSMIWEASWLPGRISKKHKRILGF